MKVKFSVIIPAAGNYKKQNFPGCEVIYVSKFGKSKARNWGSLQSKGNYLVHIDVDNKISPRVIKEAKKMIEQTEVKTIVLEEYISGNTIWQRARNLERKINLKNTPLSTPQIIDKNLFLKVGGYDERFDELDDWGLYMRLMSFPHSQSSIQHATSVFEPTNIFHILKRRFKKGRELTYFKEVYDNNLQTNLAAVWGSYTNSYHLMAKDWSASLALLTLKFFDWLGLWVGSLLPIHPRIDQMYKEQGVAKTFDTNQLGWYGRLKNWFEIRSLIKDLDSEISILDLGAGTGRITKALIDHGYRKVTPCDISSAMLAQFPKNLPRPILLKSTKLPFKDNQFHTVLSMRVIWHIKSKKRRQKFFSEAARVAKKDIIMDFSFQPSNSDHQFIWSEIKTMAKENGLTIDSKSYLPLSRLLIKFSK